MTRHFGCKDAIVEYVVTTVSNVRMIGRQRNLSIYAETEKINTYKAIMSRDKGRQRSTNRLTINSDGNV